MVALENLGSPSRQRNKSSSDHSKVWMGCRPELTIHRPRHCGLLHRGCRFVFDPRERGRKTSCFYTSSLASVSGMRERTPRLGIRFPWKSLFPEKSTEPQKAHPRINQLEKKTLRPRRLCRQDQEKDRVLARKATNLKMQNNKTQGDTRKGVHLIQSNVATHAA